MNPIPINSTNVKAFGFSTTFKLYDKKIVFDITGLTQLVVGGQAASLSIFFDVIDPYGSVLTSENRTTTNIALPGGSVFEVPIRDMNFAFGLWEIIGIIREADGKEYSIRLIKNLCKPEGFEKLSVEGKFITNVNCYSPYIDISETTKLIYAKAKPSSLTKVGKLFYPQGTLDEVDFTYTPFKVTDVFTGDYLLRNTTTAVYDLKESVFVEVKYFTNQKFEVNCNGTMASLVCCIDAVFDTYDRDPRSELGRDAKTKIDKISFSVSRALIKEKAGMPSDKEVAYIKDVLNCDCGCGELVEPIQLGGGVNVPVIQIQGACGVSIITDVAGGTKNYTVSADLIELDKDEEDLAFNINKVKSSCGYVYTFSFNYDVLSANILNTIDGSQELTELLKKILEDEFIDNELDGFEGKCIIDTTINDYLLIEKQSADGIKYVKNILIDGDEFIAPSNLSLSNTQSISNWLNSLQKGSFTVVIDVQNSAVIFQSLKNNHEISTVFFELKIANDIYPLVRQFSKTGRTVVDALQALVDAVCALNLKKIYLDRDYSIKKVDSSGNVITDKVLAETQLSVLIEKIAQSINSQAVLVSNKSINCSSIKNIFKAYPEQLNPGVDRIYGSKGGACSSISLQEIASAVINVIGSTPALKTDFCSIVSACSTQAPNSCKMPISFSVRANGDQFEVSYQLGVTQSKINVQVVRPDGSVLNTSNIGNQGTFNIPFDTELYGIYKFRALAVCDDTVNPILVSNYTAFIEIEISEDSSSYVELNVQLSHDGEFACSAPIVSVYVPNDGSMNFSGRILYYDSELTDNVSGETLVILNGDIYSINQNTGLVGSLTGQNCN